jgi:hypothetical protein
MPVIREGNKYKIGSGPAMYKSKASAVRAYRAYLAKHPEKAREDRSEHRKRAKRS